MLIFADCYSEDWPVNNQDAQKTILCYGDSNTWGYVPNNIHNIMTHKKRYPRSIRWPGQLQKLLGDNYYVIEEGLNGRTTNLNYKFPPDRNGATYLPPCLYTHAPIDLVILSLGGNDLKTYFHRSAIDICDGLENLVTIIKKSLYGCNMQEAPQILIVSQEIPLPISEKAVDEDGVFFFENAIERAKSLVGLYSTLAEKTGCYFLDVSQDIQPSKIDGVHLDAEGHGKFAILVKNKLNEIQFNPFTPN